MPCGQQDCAQAHSTIHRCGPASRAREDLTLYDKVDYTKDDFDYTVHETNPTQSLDERERRRRRQTNDLTDYDIELIGGAGVTDQAWMYNGNDWKSMAKMSIGRDRPACSLINMPDGKVTFQHNSQFAII